jgi:hypothetical protein
MLLIGLLAWPMLFTGAPLGTDWTHHLSLIWSQSQSIRANGHPGLFLNYSHSIFYPEYAFYGGTIYAIAGTLSLLLGGIPIATYVFTYLLGCGAAYGGWYWMGRMAGLGRWLAQVPGAIFVTSAYSITLIYERGDWPEFLAVSTIPLLLASGLSVLRAERLRLPPALALLASGVVFFGSHNLTLVWGSTTIALVSAITLLCVPETRAWIRSRAIARVAAVIVPALLVNAWFLLPAVAYATRTKISSDYPGLRLTLQNFMPAVSASHLFAIDRVNAIPGAKAFAVTLPIPAIAWTLVGMVLLLRGGIRAPWARMLLVCGGTSALMTIVMTHASVILTLPRPYAMLQFSYRLDSYVSLGISGCVLAVLALARGAPRRATALAWALVPVLIVAVVGAVRQTSAYPRSGALSRRAAIAPGPKPGPREGAGGDYVDADLPLLARVERVPEIYFPPASIHGERTSKLVHLAPGQAAYTNIGGGPELVHVSGARIIGRDLEGNDVVQIEPPAGSRAASERHGAPAEVVSVSPASGLPIVLGRLLTLAAAVLAAAELLVLLVREFRREPVA